MPKAIQEGGRSLDCFSINGALPTFYSKYGFLPVARVKFNEEFAPSDWNYKRDKEPDIVFMVYDQKAALNVEKDAEKRGKLMREMINHLPYSTYEKAETISIQECELRSSLLQSDNPVTQEKPNIVGAEGKSDES